MPHEVLLRQPAQKGVPIVGLIADVTIAAAVGGLGTFGITGWTWGVNLYDRKRALIDALGVWFEGDDAQGPRATLQNKLHVKNAAPTPMRGVYVLAESFTRSDDGFTSTPDDRIVFPVSLGRTIASEEHCVKDITLEPTPDNTISNETRIGLRVKEVVARDNTGRIWRVRKSLTKGTRAKKGSAEVVLVWKSNKRFNGYYAPIEGPTKVVQDH
jgi:hypothetical protein